MMSDIQTSDSLVRVCDDSELKENLKHIVDAQDGEEERQSAGLGREGAWSRSLSCSKVSGEHASNYNLNDESAMRPLKLFGEENRRKSAPTFRYRRGSLPLSDNRVAYDDSETCDEESKTSCISDGESSLLSIVDDSKTEEESQDMTHIHSYGRFKKGVGQWQGKVELALRRSMALDSSLSPARR